MNKQHQCGMSMWGYLLVVMVIITAVTMTLRLGQHYVEFAMVKATLDRIPVEQAHEMPKSEIRDHFARQFRVEGFPMPVKEILNIERSRKQTVLDFNYEVREHLFYNVDIVLVFSEQRTYD